MRIFNLLYSLKIFFFFNKYIFDIIIGGLTSSRRFTHRPHGLSSNISLSSSESSPLSLGDLRISVSLLLLRLPGMSKPTKQEKNSIRVLRDWCYCWWYCCCYCCCIVVMLLMRYDEYEWILCNRYCRRLSPIPIAHRCWSSLHNANGKAIL